MSENVIDANTYTLVNPWVREREFIFAIGRALMAEVELSEVLRVILHATTDLVASRVGMVILAEPAEQAFRVVATYGVPPRLLEQFRPLVTGIPYRDGEVREALDEVKRLARDLAEAVDPQLVNSLGLPMFNADAVIGAIFVFPSDKYVVTQSMVRFMQSFAAWAAIAVKNARLYEAVTAEKQRLNAIIQQSADGVMILDPTLTITGFNAALTRMTGVPEAEAIGRPHSAVIRWVQVRTAHDLAGALANGWPLPGANHLYVEGDIHRADGMPVSLGITYAPLLNDRGKMTSIIANVRDLTRYREEERLHKTFISVVSHELKTPVSIIKGYAGTLRRDDVDWPRAILHEYLGTIEDEADNLTDLIDNLLEASRLQSGAFRLDVQSDISLAALVRSVARKFAQQTDRHQVEIDFPENCPEIMGDERRLTQVFNNLLSNAIKYSPDGGPIRVSAEAHPDHLIVHVQDCGIGIPPHEAHRIFQQFSRLDNALSRKTEGTGLGLFLTKAIVDAHGGHIWFQDNPDGPGTTFSVLLPLRQEPEPPRPSTSPNPAL